MISMNECSDYSNLNPLRSETVKDVNLFVNVVM